MSGNNRLKRSLSNPRIIPISFLHRNSSMFSDVFYLKTLFWLEMGYRLNLKNPKTFNEKLNWMKLYDRNPLYNQLVDKYEVKAYVSERVGKEYVVPCYGVWNDVSDIDFNDLPNKFVLKVTGDSSGLIICKDKEKLDIELAKTKLTHWQHSNYYYLLREWVYKDVKSRIIADQLLDDGSGHELTDYKFWCFGGEPKVMYITNKGKDIFENFYDMDFNILEINHGFRRHIPEFERPAAFNTMKELASELSKDIPFVRVDFFYVGEKIYFGEFTFYDWGGMRPFVERSWDNELGDLIEIKKKL